MVNILIIRIFCTWYMQKYIEFEIRSIFLSVNNQSCGCICIELLEQYIPIEPVVQVANSSFQDFSALLQQRHHTNDQPVANKLWSFTCHHKLLWQRHDLLKTSLIFAFSALNSKTSLETPFGSPNCNQHAQIQLFTKFKIVGADSEPKLNRLWLPCHNLFQTCQKVVF